MLALKLAVIVLGVVLVFNRTLYRDAIDGLTLQARLLTGDTSRETRFRALARIVDPPPPADPSEPEALQLSDLLPPVVVGPLSAAWQGVAAAVTPKSYAAVQLEHWKSRSSEFATQQSFCPPDAPALPRPSKGDTVRVRLDGVTGYDNTVLFPRDVDGAARRPLSLDVKYLSADVIGGLDRSLEALVAADEAKQGCRIAACFGSSLGFGARGYWKWRVLPHEPLCVRLTLLNVTVNANVA